MLTLDYSGQAEQHFPFTREDPKNPASVTILCLVIPIHLDKSRPGANVELHPLSMDNTSPATRKCCYSAKASGATGHYRDTAYLSSRLNIKRTQLRLFKAV